MRRRKANKKELIPDTKYNSILVARLIHTIMERGKKSTAQGIIYKAFEEIKKGKEIEPIDIFIKAIENSKPKLEVKSRRVGGATYQVPVEIHEDRQITLALKWLKIYARGRKGLPMYKSLALELIDAYNNTGSIIKKKEDTHKMAAANKAFAHYRW